MFIDLESIEGRKGKEGKEGRRMRKKCIELIKDSKGRVNVSQ